METTAVSDDDDVLIIDDDSDDESVTECSDNLGKLTEDSDQCKNPWHEKWGDDKSGMKNLSQVPKTAKFTFQLLGYQPLGKSRAGTQKFCTMCISRATNLTVEEFKELETQAKSNWKNETNTEKPSDPDRFSFYSSRKLSENAQIQAHLDKLDKLDISDEEKSRQVKQLRMLAFVNPGKFMDDFDPERSEREMKKMNRRLTKERSLKKNQLYDEAGLLLSNRQDLCDCLDTDCIGCHFPCPKCQSEKCGGECRVNRKWMYEYIESEGTGLTFSAKT